MRVCVWGVKCGVCGGHLREGYLLVCMSCLVSPQCSMCTCMCVCLTYLEMSPQYHSASCSAMLLFIPLFVTGAGFGGLGGSAAQHKKHNHKLISNRVPINYIITK